MKNFLLELKLHKKSLQNRHVIIFLDYDGTLTPIVDTPSKASLSEKTRGLLKCLSSLPDCELAIVSGRAMKELRRLVGLQNIIYAGNHGFEIEGPDVKFDTLVSAKISSTLAEIKSELEEKISAIPGVLIENKGLSLSVHYRLVEKRDSIRLLKMLLTITKRYLVKKQIRVTSGKKVFEIRPPVDWDKGKAVSWILDQRKNKLRNIFPIAIGDDKTDEDMFAFLRKKGLTVQVGLARETSAEFILKGPQEVFESLEYIWKSKTGNMLCQN